MQCARKRPGGQESPVKLEVFVAADALDSVPLAVGVDHEDLVSAVRPSHRHGAIGDLVDSDEVDPSHAAALLPATTPASHLASSILRRRTCASASGTRATTGSRNPRTMNFRASSGGIPRLSR